MPLQEQEIIVSQGPEVVTPRYEKTPSVETQEPITKFDNVTLDMSEGSAPQETDSSPAKVDPAVRNSAPQTTAPSAKPIVSKENIKKFAPIILGLLGVFLITRSKK